MKREKEGGREEGGKGVKEKEGGWEAPTSAAVTLSFWQTSASTVESICVASLSPGRGKRYVGRSSMNHLCSLIPWIVIRFTGFT